MTTVGALARAEVAPRPLFCAIEHLHQDRGVANAVRAGRFTHAGITRDLGPEPDWLGAALPRDEEWRLEWVKFYYGLDLASAFARTGDRGYLSAWERLVRSWVRTVPVALDPSEVAARRIQNWLYAWNAFAAAPAFRGLDEGLADELLASIAEQTVHVRENLTAERNHRTLELYALFLVPLAFPELDADARLLRFAVAELKDDLEAAFRPDGVHRESSTHYHMVVLRTFLAARENARRYGVGVGGSYDELLSRACEFAMHAHRPDGRIAALSDGDSVCYAELLALAARLLGRRDLRWVATSGRAGRPPARENASFCAGGYFFQRSGWGDGAMRFPDERYCVFDCGPLGDGGHGHYDLLGVEIAAGGRPLVVDPGRYTYSEHGANLRRWFKGTAAHNTVCVDGLDQTPYRRGKPRGPVAEGRFLGRLSAPGVDLLAGRAKSPAYEAVHERRVVFVAGEYWLIEDRLGGREPHRYDLRFHLLPTALGRLKLTDRAVRAPGFALVFAAPSAPRVEPGWVSFRYGRKEPAPVVSVAVDGLCNTVLLTLVVPLARAQPVPTLRVRRLGGATAVEVRGVSRDRVYWDERRVGLRRSVLP